MTVWGVGGAGQDRNPRAPTSAPYSSAGTRLQDVQGFVAGTLDTVGRFVSNIRTRPTAADVGPVTGNTPPSAVTARSTQAFTIGGAAIAVVLVVGAVFLFMRKRG